MAARRFEHVAPSFDEKFDVPPQPYASVPAPEDCKRAARHRAMDEYGKRPDVQDMLFRYLHDLLTTQPNDSLEFMLKWATKEAKNPERASTPPAVDHSMDKYNLRVDLKEKKPWE